MCIYIIIYPYSDIYIYILHILVIYYIIIYILYIIYNYSIYHLIDHLIQFLALSHQKCIAFALSPGPGFGFEGFEGFAASAFASGAAFAEAAVGLFQLVAFVACGEGFGDHHRTRLGYHQLGWKTWVFWPWVVLFDVNRSYCKWFFWVF